MDQLILYRRGLSPPNIGQLAWRTLAAFPWARFRSAKGAVKLHTLMDLRGSIPTFMHISDGRLHDVKVLDQLPPEPGSIYVMDRAYVDFQRLFRLQQAAAFYVVRQKTNLLWQRRYSRPVDKRQDLRCDQTIMLIGQPTAAKYPAPLRRVGFRDVDKQRTFHFLTNHFDIPARTVADLYRLRWRVELLFRWLKQHLRIQRFLGTSANAVKTQIWIAVSVYVLIAILKKRLELPAELYAIVQVLGLTPFEQVPLQQLFASDRADLMADPGADQLSLFES